MTRADNDGNVLFAVGGVSSTDSSTATLSLSSASKETETQPRKLAIAMPAREVARAGSAPAKRQASLSPGHGSSRNKLKALPAPPTAKVRSSSRRSGKQSESSESSEKDRSRSNETAKRRATRRAEKKAIEDSPRDRKPPVRPREVTAAMEMKTLSPKSKGVLIEAPVVGEPL